MAENIEDELTLQLNNENNMSLREHSQNTINSYLEKENNKKEEFSEKITNLSKK